MRHFDVHGSGNFINEEAGEALGLHKLVYRDINSTWSLADADLAATMPVIGITMGAIGVGLKGEILLEGYIGDTSWNWNPGEDLYASTTPGELTAVAPVAPDVVQAVAVAVTTTLIYFHAGMASGTASTGECAILEGHTAYVGTNTCREPQTNYWLIDGVADDVQINAALAYVNGLGGGTVFLERGPFVLADSITFPGNDTTLCGTGYDSFINGDGLATTEHAIVISGRTNCGVKDVSIQTEDGGGKTCHCIFIEDGANEFLIENVYIGDSDSNGIHIEGTAITGGRIINCYIADVDEIGININMDGGAEDFTQGKILNNIVENAGTVGVYLREFDYCHVTGNKIESAGEEGLYLYNADYCVVTDNIIKDSVRHGLRGYNLDRSTVSNNVIENSDSGNTGTYDGINLSVGSSSNIVDSNIVSLNDRYGIYLNSMGIISNNQVYYSGHDGINLGSSADYSTIIGNKLTADGQKTTLTYSGIDLDGPEGVSVIGNQIRGDNQDTLHGIRLSDGATECLIEGNYISLCMGSGIYLEANNDDCELQGNYCNDNDDYGIEIAAATCDRTRVFNNNLLSNTLGFLSDGGTDTITPEFFAPVTDLDGAHGPHPRVILTDGLVVVVNSHFCAPLSYQGLISAEAIVVPNGTGNMRWSFSAEWGKICSESFEQSGVIIPETVTAVTLDTLECIDISDGLVGVEAGDLVGMQFERHADDVTDTVNEDCYYMGIRVRYV